MNLPKPLEVLVLLIAVYFPFYWYNQTYLSPYSLQLVGLLILIAALHNLLARNKSPNNPVSKYQNVTNVIIVTVLTLLLILSTEGASSPLFFLLDFLLFFIALFTHPRQSFTLSLAITITFLLNEPLLDNQQLTNLVSLLLMAPLASFFSTQYLRLIEAKTEIKMLSDQAKEQETDMMIWLTLNFHNKIVQSIDLLSQITANLGQIPYHQRQKLNQLYQDLKALFKSGQELEKKIDELSDQ
jgi:hypothetical protein